MSSPPRTLIFATLEKLVVETAMMIHKNPMTNVDEIPSVCFAEDLARIFRVPVSRLKQREKHRYTAFPALPRLDRRHRYSGAFVKWFLEIDDYSYRRFKEALEGEQKARRQRHKDWYEYAPPHTIPYSGAPRKGEEPTVRLSAVASILRISQSTLRNIARRIDSPLPPARLKPLTWTEGQLSRFLAPPDVTPLLRELTRRANVREQAKKKTVASAKMP
jgi:hypothetical protein